MPGDARVDADQEVDVAAEVYARRHRKGWAFIPLGDTLLMFTDGLVERRAVPMHAGLDNLVDVLGKAFGLPLDGLCDVVLTEMAPFAGEDDVALIAVRNG